MDRVVLPPLMGHRGVAATAPENTLAGLRAAAAAGLGWVEFDVTLTADSRPVLFHDETLERITGVAAAMAETPWARLCELDAGARFAARFAGERVPSLEEALGVLLSLGLHPNLEIKPSPGRDVETAVAIVEVLSRAWPAAKGLPLLSSFSVMSLAAARALRPNWPLALIAERPPRDWRARLQALGCVSFHLNGRHLTRAVVREVQAAGYQVAAYTINEARRAKALAVIGVDSLISDAPEDIARGLGIAPGAHSWPLQAEAGG